MSEKDISELISTLHKMVHRELKGVASEIQVKGEHLYFNLMFKLNGSHINVAIKRQIHLGHVQDTDIMSQFLFNEVLAEMNYVIMESYKRSDKNEQS